MGGKVCDVNKMGFPRSNRQYGYVQHVNVTIELSCAFVERKITNDV